MRNAGLNEAQAGIKIAGRNINNLRYADDTTLRAESEEELESLLMKVKEDVLVCIPTNSVRGFPFLHTLSIIYCLQIFGSQPFWLVWSGTSLWFWLAFL